MPNFLILAGIALVITGFLLLLFAMIVPFLRGEGINVEIGSVIMIGPIPIVLADDPKTARTLMILALLMMVASFLMILFMNKM